MFHDILFLIIGLVLIIAGGNYLTDGAESIARRFNISSLVIGLTVVAFGSSTPDFVVAFMSTIENKAQLAIGDVVGANIFDLLLVVGITAIVAPVPVSKGLRRKEIPMLILSALALFFCGDDRLFDGGAADIISRTDGLMLIDFFIIYMFFTLSLAHEPSPTPDSASTGAASSPAKATAQASEAIHRSKSLWIGRIRRIADPPKDMPIWMAAVCIVGGLAALVIGGNWIVDGASGIALKAGLSEALVGLTIVAVGSSVPDLATSLIAALKKQTGIALGNVIGACVFNVFFIIGVCSTVRPMHTGNISFIDYGTLTLASILLWIFGSLSKNKSINRWAGVLLVLGYCAYMAYLIIFTT